MNTLLLVIYIFASNAMGESYHMEKVIMVDSKIQAVGEIIKGDCWRRHSTIIHYFKSAELWYVSEDGIKREVLSYDFFEEMDNIYKK